MDRLRRASVGALVHDLDARSPAGCAIGLHIRFTMPSYMFQSYPRRWIDHYATAGLFAHDPTVRWGMANVGWVRWEELERIDGSGVLQQARNHGIMNGVTIALVAERSRTIASFARSDRDYEAEEIAALERIVADLHRATANPELLTSSDRQALRRLSDRLTH